MTHITNMTSEQMKEAREKARQSKIAKRESAEKHLKTDCLDDDLWKVLAKQYGIRLPSKYDKASSKFVNRALKSLSLSKEWYTDLTGFSNGNQEASANPTMTARQQVGLILEELDFQHNSI